jgi:uncharacterized protein YdiU (UPF0061 family)
MLTPAGAAQVFPFDNSYARLPERFFARLPPSPVAEPRLARLNEKLARQLGLDPAKLSSPEGVAMLAGNTVPELGEPLAMAYAGHQFGNFVPQLGDGRALLLGEVVDRDGVRRDIQLKGSGPTPFSRNGDGRAALGPVLREYIISEAMHALGIPTTRSLAVVTTGQTVRREQPLPGAVLASLRATSVSAPFSSLPRVAMLRPSTSSPTMSSPATTLRPLARRNPTKCSLTSSSRARPS